MQDINRSRVLLTVGTASSYCLVPLLAYITTLKLKLDGTWNAILLVAFFTCVLSVVASRFKWVTLRATIECLGCGFLLIIPITISTYIAAKLNFPLADAQLARWDSMLGVDWPFIMRWVDEHSLAAEVFNRAYRTFSYQLILYPIVLIVFNKINQAYQMVSVYGLLCFLASAVSIFWPALGTYTFYQFDASTLKNLDATYGYFFLEQFQAVRDNPDFVWSLEQSAGIVTFPSVHAAVATLCAWAIRPVRLLHYPVLVLNIAMALSAVPAANHYFIDVIAGCLVALVSIILVRSVTQSREGIFPELMRLRLSTKKVNLSPE